VPVVLVLQLVKVRDEIGAVHEAAALLHLRCCSGLFFNDTSAAGGKRSKRLRISLRFTSVRRPSFLARTRLL
jgi:hypothetical protein